MKMWFKEVKDKHYQKSLLFIVPPFSWSFKTCLHTQIHTLKISETLDK